MAKSKTAPRFSPSSNIAARKTTRRTTGKGQKGGSGGGKGGKWAAYVSNAPLRD